MKAIYIYFSIAWHFHISLKREESFAPYWVNGPENLYGSCVLVDPFLLLEGSYFLVIQLQIIIEV